MHYTGLEFCLVELSHTYTFTGSTQQTHSVHLSLKVT